MLIRNSLNTRDLADYLDGGATMGRGRIIRGEAPWMLGEEGVDDLVAGGVRTVIDLRGARERQAQGYGTAIKYYNSGVLILLEVDLIPSEAFKSSPAGKDPYNHLAEAYLACLENGGVDLCQALNLAVEEGGGLYVHCALGKDRTGMVAALLLTALGASREQVLADYMAAGKVMPALVEKIKENDPEGKNYPEFVNPNWPTVMPRSGVLDDMLNQLENQVGAASWLENQGLNLEGLKRHTHWQQEPSTRVR